MELGMAGRRAVVTGAGAGIGRAVVETLTSDRASHITGTVLAVHGGMAHHLM